MKPPERIRLRLLGRLAIAYGDGGPPIRLSTRKAGALIAYLAMRPEQTASREELATLLWGASTDQQARQSLRQALVLLRKELGWSHFMVADAAVVRLQPGLWSVDAGDFDRLSRSTDPQELARAAELFGGDFLTGLNLEEEGFDEWVAAQRQRVQLAAARLCETFATRPELVTDPQQAVGAVERLVALDPLREDWHRLALTLYARYRGRNEALAQADVFAETLRRELGVAPDKATRALIEKIRASEAASQHAPIEMIVPAASMSPSVAPAPQPRETVEPIDTTQAPLAALPAAQPIRLPRPAAAVVALAGVILLAAVGLTIPQLRDANHDVVMLHPSAPAASIARWRPPAGLEGSQEQPRAAIAVLPFLAQGDTAALQPAADAMTDDLINMLARVPTIRVISRATMESYRGQPIDVAAVAAELDVSYVLEGVVRQEGDKLRVNVELIKPATRSPIWSARIERANDEQGKVRDEIVTQLARELQVGTPAVEAGQVPPDPTLRQLYQQGWAAIYASGRSPEMLHQAEAAFSRALAESPQSRWARVGLANTHALSAALAIDADIETHLAKAEALLTSLIAENPDNAGPYFAMGLVHEFRGRPMQAVDAFKRVLASNPSHAPSYSGIGHALILAGKPAEGLGYLHYAMRLSPRDAQRAHWLRFAGEAELELGHFDQALDLLRESLALAPRQVPTLRAFAVGLAAAGRLDEAHKALAEMRAVNPALTDARLLRFVDKYKATRREMARGMQLLLAPATTSQEASGAPDPATRTTPPAQSSGVATILILPFGQLGEGNERSRLWADILVDDLTNAVSRVGGFRVISRRTAAGYRGKRVDPKTIGAELGVQYLVDGRVEARGEGLRASVELIDTKNGLRAWSGNYERGGADLPAIVDEIVRSVGRELQVEVTRIASSRDSGDLDVHALIYKGFAALGAGWRDAGALAQAKQYFTEARARDPNSTRAMTGLGAYHVAAASKLLRADREPHLKEAEALLRGVIERRPDVGGPSMFLGMVSYLRGQDDEAIRWFERELERNPSQSRAYAHLGRALTRSGKPEEGLRQILYAIRLSPSDPAIPEWLAFAGRAELELGHCAKAIEYLERAISLHAASPPELVTLAAARALDGDLDAARMRLDQAQQKSADFSRAILARRFVDGPTRSGEARLAEGLRLALAPAADSWQPPGAADPTGAQPARANPSGLTAILVLPFASIGESSEASRLSADLVTDDLTNALSRISGFRVISRQTAMTYRGQQVDAAAIGAELGVRYVLQGSVGAQGPDLNASVELIDARSRLRVWSGTYNRVGTDRVTVLDDIVKQVGRELQIEVTRAEGAITARNPDVHALIYKGYSAIIDTGRLGRPALEQAREYFEQALAREPDNLRAQAGLGTYHMQMALQLFADDPAPHLTEAEAIFQRVIAKDPEVGGPYRLMGMVEIARGHPDIAAKWFQREIDVNPSEAAAYAQLGRTMAIRGQPAEGMKYILYAIRLSPRDPAMPYWLSMAGFAELEQGHDRKAIEYDERALALKPGHPRALMVIAAAHALSGNIDAARARLEELRKANPHLSDDKLLERYFGTANGAESGRLREGLRLALAPARDPWASPPSATRRAEDPTAAPAKRNVALLVLPFTTSGDAAGATQSLADMVTDDLTNLLSRVASLRVISRQTALTFKGKPIDVAALGQELQVRYVLEGTMRMQEGKLRVNLELTDPATRLPVWTTRIDQASADRNTIVDAIVERLARELQVNLIGIEAERRSKDTDTDALVARGWAALFNISAAGYRQAEALFREALERDPQSVPAMIGMGAYHARIGALALDNEPLVHRAKAQELLREAIRREPNASAAHFYLGLALKRAPTFMESIEEMQRAIELNPSFPAAYVHIGHSLAQIGRAEEGIEQVKYGLRLSPRDTTMGVFLDMAGDVELILNHLDAAIDDFHRSAELKPAYPRPWAGLAAAYALTGRMEEARNCAEKLKSLMPGLSPDGLVEQFGRNADSRLNQGLRLAFTPSLATTAHIRTAH